MGSAFTSGLNALCRRAGVTPFMALLAGFQILLHRYTSEADIAVGSPVSNRSRVPFERLIGFFVNTLVLRTDLSGNPRFLDLLGQVRRRALGAYSNQELPFERVVEELRPGRDSSRLPLFQVMFLLTSSYDMEREFPVLACPDLSIQWEPMVRRRSKFELTLQCAPWNVSPPL